ncbi:MAG: sigma-70 family RNA polymerase sigma factor [Sphingobacteriia bacterium]|nr:sigma-70 family RNA polymerase sigma factor [Sphingobacteriia bacterium]
MDPVKERVIQHIKLAQIIASKYFNIQGASREEVLSEAQMALVKAAMAYREEKGPFAPFAGTVIRNALNSLFNKQLRNAKMVAKSLDETMDGATQFGTYIGNLGQNIADTKRDVFQEVGERERSKELKRASKNLSSKEKEIINGISKGMSLSEIAKEQKVSKQAIFKILKKAYVKIKNVIKIC